MKKRRRRRRREIQYEYEDRDEGLAWHTNALTVVLVEFLRLAATVAVGLFHLLCCLWPKRSTDQEE